MKHTTSYAIQRRRSLMLEFALLLLAVTALAAESAAMYYGRNIEMPDVPGRNGVVTHLLAADTLL